MKLSKLFGLCLICGWLAACTSISASTEIPVVRVSDITILPEENGRSDFEVTLLVSNPNAEAIELSSIDFSIRLAGEGFVEGVITAPGTLAPASDTRVRGRVSSEFVSSISRLVAYLQGAESTLPYELEGTLYRATRPPRPMRFSGSGRTPLIMSAGR